MSGDCRRCRLGKPSNCRAAAHLNRRARLDEMAAAAADDVEFECFAEGSRLRVRVTSAGYNRFANCQFPRDIRVAGARFTAPRHALTFASGPGGTFFYRVRPSLIRPVVGAPTRVFEDVGVDECAICLCDPKAVVFTPCGHFHVCAGCAARLGARAPCPICRTPIAGAIPRSMFA
jgi:Zinc finger, C3HC4 type (RING finger)